MENKKAHVSHHWRIWSLAKEFCKVVLALSLRKYRCCDVWCLVLSNTAQQKNSLWITAKQPSLEYCRTTAQAKQQHTASTPSCHTPTTRSSSHLDFDTSPPCLDAATPKDALLVPLVVSDLCAVESWAWVLEVGSPLFTTLLVWNCTIRTRQSLLHLTLNGHLCHFPFETYLNSADGNVHAGVVHSFSILCPFHPCCALFICVMQSASVLCTLHPCCALCICAVHSASRLWTLPLGFSHKLNFLGHKKWEHLHLQNTYWGNIS